MADYQVYDTKTETYIYENISAEDAAEKLGTKPSYIDWVSLHNRLLQRRYKITKQIPTPTLDYTYGLYDMQDNELCVFIGTGHGVAKFMGCHEATVRTAIRESNRLDYRYEIHKIDD